MRPLSFPKFELPEIDVRKKDSLPRARWVVTEILTKCRQ